MDFSKVEIKNILKSALPRRFQDLPHTDFEDFVAQLFKDNGYEVKQTPYSGDYGADLIIEKNNERIAVQVKRYAQNNTVGVKDINQVIGARDYYKCTSARIITTSSFTTPGKSLARGAIVDLWDWDSLQRYICTTYLGGTNCYEYFAGESGSKMALEAFEVTFAGADFGQRLKGMGGRWAIIYLTLKNKSDQNIPVGLAMPIYVTKDNRQIEAYTYLSGYFAGGVVYAGCSVETAFWFNADQLKSAQDGDTVVFRWLNEKGESLSQNCKIHVSQRHNSKCFVVTMCYGYDSSEYRQMIMFRDRWLATNGLGRFIVRKYYEMSPTFVAFCIKHRIPKLISRACLFPIILLARIANSGWIKNSG